MQLMEATFEDCAQSGFLTLLIHATTFMWRLGSEAADTTYRFTAGSQNGCFALREF